jgi:hypothetical protein
MELNPPPKNLTATMSASSSSAATTSSSAGASSSSSSGSTTAFREQIGQLVRRLSNGSELKLETPKEGTAAKQVRDCCCC